MNSLDELPVVADEFDYPQCSWSTGHADSASEAIKQCPAVWRRGLPSDEAASLALPLASIYSRMRARNRCNHRDFQNIGVNGGRAGAMAPPGIVNGMARDPVHDNPALVFHALIGNDVCNGHPGIDSMTKPVSMTKTSFPAAKNQFLALQLPAVATF